MRFPLSRPRDTVPAMIRPWESVMVPEFTEAMGGPSGINFLNRAAEAKARMPLRHFVKGGVANELTDPEFMEALYRKNQQLGNERDFDPDTEIKYQFRDKLAPQHFAGGGVAGGGVLPGDLDQNAWGMDFQGSYYPPDWMGPDNSPSNPQAPYEGTYGGTDDNPTSRWMPPEYRNYWAHHGGDSGNNDGLTPEQRYNRHFGKDSTDRLNRIINRHRGDLPNYDSQGLHDIFNENRGSDNGFRGYGTNPGYLDNDRITGYTDASGVHVNAEHMGGGGDATGGGTGSGGPLSTLGASGNPAPYLGGSPFVSSSNSPTGFDAQGNPVYGGQPGGFNIPGGIGLGGLGGSAHASGEQVPFWSRMQMRQARNASNIGGGGAAAQLAASMGTPWQPLAAVSGGGGGGGMGQNNEQRFGPNARRMSSV